MKSKTKFDPKLIQQFFIDHTEKFVLGLVALFFVLFAYQSFLTVGSGYQKKPEELQSAINAASSKMTQGPATKRPETVAAFPSYSELIDDARRSIDPHEYPTSLGWDPKPIAPRKLRDAPDVLPVEQLRAIAGRGAVLKAKESANGDTVGKRWVVVTGLVPYKKQLTEYLARFEGAALYDPPKDIPKYWGFLVQRVEATPGDTQDPDWSKAKFVIFPFTADGPAKWGSPVAEEITDPRFVLPSLTAPLPELADGTWGSEVVSPKQIPVVERQAESADGAAHPSPVRGGTPRRSFTRQPSGGGHGAPSRGQDDTNPSDADILGTVPPKAAAEGAAKDEELQMPDYRLLRYFDFDVKPNKQYHYRIFLVLHNPSYSLAANVLVEPDLARDRYIGLDNAGPIKDAAGKFVDWRTIPEYAKWSSPCTSDRIPGDMRLLGGQVAAAHGLQDASAEVRILLWLDRSGLDGSFAKEGLGRGTILNFPEAAVRSPGRRATTKVDLTTDSVLIDLAGGDPVPDKEHHLTTPGMVLVMDRSGNLVMHDEVAENEAWGKATREPQRREAPQHNTERRPPVRRPPERTGDHSDGGFDPHEFESERTKQRPGR